MNHSDLVRFATLFAGRTDAYFLSTPRPRAKHSRVSLGLFRDHLSGSIDIGTYPVRDDATCRWGCIDIDTPKDGSDDESYRKATDIASVWAYYGTASWIERSRTKGYHVWIFSDWVPARLMRQAGLWINHVSEADSPEINPKNSAPWLTADGLINTVRTPYAGAVAPGRMVMLDENAKDVDCADFANAAFAQLARRSLLGELADRWSRKVQQESRAALLENRTVGDQFSRPLGLGTPRAGRQAAVQILQGTRRAEAGERDNQFFTMACYLGRQGHPLALALRMIETAWRDQVSDKDGFGLAEAREKVFRVYRKNL